MGERGEIAQIHAGQIGRLALASVGLHPACMRFEDFGDRRVEFGHVAAGARFSERGGEIGAVEIGAVQDRAHENGAGKIRARKIAAREVGVLEIGAGQLRVAQIGARQLAAAHHRVGEVGLIAIAPVMRARSRLALVVRAAGNSEGPMSLQHAQIPEAAIRN